jgi:hypothetical protein
MYLNNPLIQFFKYLLGIAKPCGFIVVQKKPLVITTIVVGEIAACPAATVPCRGGGYAIHITHLLYV